MSNTTGGYRPIDSKREEFRKYLEKAGVMDALTKVLVMLYEEVDKPQDALDYVIKNLCADRPEAAELDNLRAGMETMKLKIADLEKQKSSYRSRLSQYENVDLEEEEQDEEDNEAVDEHHEVTADERPSGIESPKKA